MIFITECCLEKKIMSRAIVLVCFRPSATLELRAHFSTFETSPKIFLIPRHASTYVYLEGPWDPSIESNPMS